MKFLFTIHNFLPEPIFGAEKVCLQQMKELLRRGHEVALFYAGNEELAREELDRNDLNGLKTFRVGYFPTRAQIILSAWKPHVGYRFKKTLDSFRPDVVVFHHLVRLSADLPKIVHDRRIRTVFYLHDFFPICPSYSLYKPENKICTKRNLADCAGCLSEIGLGSKGLTLPSAIAMLPFHWARKKIFAELAKNIDLFVSPSRFVLNIFEEFHFPLRPSTVIPNGCEKKQTLLPEERKKAGTLRFGYLGNMIAKKGIDVLARAFQGELSHSLVMCGFKDELAIQIFRDKYPDLHAQFRVFDPNIESFFEAVDVVIVPSLWYENQPTVIVEAYQHGKPVICSNIGGIPEMVKDNHGGLLFQAGNSEDLRSKVNYLHRNSFELERMRRCIPQWPTTEETTDRLIAEIRKINI